MAEHLLGIVLRMSLQIAIKILVTIFIIAGGIISVLWVWRKDIDIRKTFSPSRIVAKVADAPSSFIVERDQKSIYQDGEPCGAVTTFKVDDESKQVIFDEISRSGSFDIDRQFEFRKYVLKISGIDTMIGMEATHPEKGRVLIKCSASIIRER